MQVKQIPETQIKVYFTSTINCRNSFGIRSNDPIEHPTNIESNDGILQSYDHGTRMTKIKNKFPISQQ